MTTIIGVRTNYGDDAIVLASDRQIGDYEQEILTAKGLGKKIQTGPFWVMGHSGGQQKRCITKFFGILKGYKNYSSSDEKAREIIQIAIRKKRFYEVDELNAEISRSEDDIDSTLEFILAVNNPKLEMWKVNEFGVFHDVPDSREIDYITIGSGADAAVKFIYNQIADARYDIERINTRAAIQIARDVMHISEKDPATGLGYHLIIMTKDSIKEWGEEIKKAVVEAQDIKIKSIQDYYDPPQVNSSA